jgi:hypothetical protein
MGDEYERVNIESIIYVYNELSYRFPYLYQELDQNVFMDFILELQPTKQYPSSYTRTRRQNVFIKQFSEELECCRYLLDKYIYSIKHLPIELVDLLLDNHPYYIKHNVSIYS